MESLLTIMTVNNVFDVSWRKFRMTVLCTVCNKECAN